jgi:hypothetical protein
LTLTRTWNNRAYLRSPVPQAVVPGKALGAKCRGVHMHTRVAAVRLAASEMTWCTPPRPFTLEAVMETCPNPSDWLAAPDTGRWYCQLGINSVPIGWQAWFWLPSVNNACRLSLAVVGGESNLSRVGMFDYPLSTLFSLPLRLDELWMTELAPTFPLRRVTQCRESQGYGPRKCLSKALSTWQVQSGGLVI